MMERMYFFKLVIGSAWQVRLLMYQNAFVSEDSLEYDSLVLHL